MEHKNAGSITELELYDGFVWVQEDSQAVSMFYGKKIVWSFITGVDEIKKWHMYAQISYAMLAATHSKEELKEIDVDPVKILVQPDGVKPFTIEAKSHDTHHAIVGKLQIHFERIKT